MEKEISIEEEVMFYDTDCAGIVHNLSYLRFIEKARTKLAELLGMPIADMAHPDRVPVLVRTEIDYKASARLGDRLRIVSRLDRVQTVRFWCRSEIHRVSDNLLIANCYQKLALVRVADGRPTPLPAHWREAVEESIEDA